MSVGELREALADYVDQDLPVVLMVGGTECEEFTIDDIEEREGTIAVALESD